MSDRKWPAPIGGLLAVTIGVTVGCSCSRPDAHDELPPTAGGSTTVSVVAGSRLAEVCTRLCERMAQCAGVTAGKMAKELGADAKAVGRAAADGERGARAELGACHQDCEREQGSSPAASRIDDADQCLALGDCEAFLACLDRIAQQ